MNLPRRNGAARKTGVFNRQADEANDLVVYCFESWRREKYSFLRQLDLRWQGKEKQAVILVISDR